MPVTPNRAASEDAHSSQFVKMFLPEMNHANSCKLCISQELLTEELTLRAQRATQRAHRFSL
jgi:hypothetical protein